MNAISARPDGGEFERIQDDLAVSESDEENPTPAVKEVHITTQAQEDDAEDGSVWF